MDMEERMKRTLSGRSEEFAKAFRNLILEVAYSLKIDKFVGFLNRVFTKWI